MNLITIRNHKLYTGCYNGELRGEELPNINGVELCVDNEWRTVCRGESSNGWNIRAANIVCNQLGYLDKGRLSKEGPPHINYIVAPACMHVCRCNWSNSVSIS